MDLSGLEQWVGDQLIENYDFVSSFGNTELEQIIQCIDLTTLNSTDSPNSVLDFITSGRSFLETRNLPPVAAFCVFSNFAALVKEALVDSNISTACVATCFPHGQASLNVKLEEVRDAQVQGADEIDIVINRGMVLDGDYDSVSREVSEFKRVSGNAHVKVILEVCELSLEQVYELSQLTIKAGADFLKTSTGKGDSGANLKASLAMCLAIKEHYKDTGEMVGFKAAGGISSSKTAIQYYNLVGTVLGPKWQTKEYFRIGASSLLKNITGDLS